MGIFTRKQSDSCFRIDLTTEYNKKNLTQNKTEKPDP